MELNTLEERNSAAPQPPVGEQITLADGIYVNHLITKRLEVGRMVLFMEVLNNTDDVFPSGKLYFDFRTLLNIKVAVIGCEISEEIKPRERFIFRMEVPKHATKFKKFGWFFQGKGVEKNGIGKNSGKKDDLVKYQKVIDNLQMASDRMKA